MIRMPRKVEIGTLALKALLCAPEKASAFVIFAHGSDAGRLSPRKSYVAEALRGSGLATLLLDLLAPDEEFRRSNVFDIPLLATGLSVATVGAWIDARFGRTFAMRRGGYPAAKAPDSVWCRGHGARAGRRGEGVGRPAVGFGRRAWGVGGNEAMQ